MRGFVACVLAAQVVAAQVVAGQAEDSLPVEYEPVYHDWSYVSAWMDGWSQSRTEIRALNWAQSAGGRPVRALLFGAPGEMALDERPHVWLIGGLDGISLSGSEAVLHCAQQLLESLDELPAGLTFIAHPWASPDALTRALAGEGEGRNDRPIDDDGDGQSDEDGPEDVDGDGLVLDMLVPDTEGQWTFGEGDRFPRAPRAREPRYRWVREGKDDDGDGRFNEDGLGGVRLDRSFPLGWSVAHESRGEHWGGDLPLSEPAAEALAQSLWSRPTAVVVFFQGNHGGLRLPGADPGRELVSPVDRSTFEVLYELFERETNRSRTMVMSSTAGVFAGGGDPIDWVYAVPGAVAFEVAAWGPRVAAPPKLVSAQDASLRELGEIADSSDRDPWLRWLDDERGGIGFVDWHPVELGGDQRVYVGGWEPFARRNPPPEDLAGALEGLDRFTSALVAAMPRLDVQEEVVRDGELCRVSLTVRNVGLLPTALSTTGALRSDGPRGIEVRLELPVDAKRIAGAETLRAPALVAGGAGHRFEWLLVMPPGGVLQYEITGDWVETVSGELQP